MIREIGLHGIEIWKGHADFGDPSVYDDVCRAYDENGVRIVSTGVNAISGNDTEDRPLFEFAKKAGCSAMSINFSLASIDTALKNAESLSEEYGIPLGIHNHGGRHWLGNAEALRWIFSKSSKRIGLSLDTAWALDSREDPVAWMKEFGERLHILHLKDFVFSKDGTPEDVIVGNGNLDLDETAKALSEIGFHGLSIIEFEGDASNPVPALKECVAGIREKLSAFFDEE
jgi:sugar phosphate isomerase/epimerase